jgi:hypothetical protein
MILRGRQIQRDGHGRCGLLFNRALSNNRSELPSSGVLAHTGTKMHNLWLLVITSTRRWQNWSDCKDPEPIQVAQARCRVVHLPPA